MPSNCLPHDTVTLAPYIIDCMLSYVITLSPNENCKLCICIYSLSPSTTAESFVRVMILNYFGHFISWLVSLLVQVIKLILPLKNPLTSQKIIVPESVNFFPSRQCNYQCKRDFQEHFILIPKSQAVSVSILPRPPSSCLSVSPREAWRC